MNEKFERITRIRLPFDGRDPDPKKNYGIHGLDIFFILKGPKGATQFFVSFGIYLTHVQKELERKPSARSLLGHINGFDVGYHSKEPQYEGHTQMSKCDIFEPCYYDGSSLRAHEWVDEIFSKPGMDHEQIIWDRLEKEYKEMFEK